MTSIVLGLGFGDEGKGLATSYLCSKVDNPLVVRFNGGHQAGHTVLDNGKRHVFSSFGSGTLQGVPTFWSRFCTVHPTAFMNEFRVLKSLGVNPSMMVTLSALCPVTTPYDIVFNRKNEELYRHGTVGVGFGATLARHEAYHKIYVQDLMYPKILMEKMKLIKNYYIGIEVSEEELDSYYQDVRDMMACVSMANENDYCYLEDTSEDLIFEGAQGILLDMDHGFFPHVTRSNTTCKNVFELVDPDTVDKILYVTRCYQTRHGAGFMSNESEWFPLVNADQETNIYNTHQGKFRKGEFDQDMIDYAMEVDALYHKSTMETDLLITCIDQRPDFDLNKAAKANDSLCNILYSEGPSKEEITYF